MAAFHLHTPSGTCLCSSPLSSIWVECFSASTPSMSLCVYVCDCDGESVFVLVRLFISMNMDVASLSSHKGAAIRASVSSFAFW
eukprot:m.105969 g.105969  ORF g.105969 m.105969 type:complete len:84 (-) comp14213_c0_seq6:866-1117(-)